MILQYIYFVCLDTLIDDQNKKDEEKENVQTVESTAQDETYQGKAEESNIEEEIKFIDEDENEEDAKVGGKDEQEEEVNDGENGVEEAEAEAEPPCAEEVEEPVEAIIDDVEIESVSDNIETGSENSTSSDTAASPVKQRKLSCKMIGAVLVGFLAIAITLLFMDVASLTKAIPFVQPEPEPKPFWKIF